LHLKRIEEDKSFFKALINLHLISNTDLCIIKTKIDFIQQSYSSNKLSVGVYHA